MLLALYFAAAPFGYALFTCLRFVPVRDREKRAHRLQGILRFAFGTMHAALHSLRVVDFDTRDLRTQIPDTPCVLVANHPTLMDVSALYASVPHLSSAVKPAIFRRFWVRPLLEQAAQFQGASPGPLDLQRMLDDCVDRLRRGYRVLLFPEGTRSPAQGLAPFGRSAFEAAVRAEVPVVPLIISCTPRWLSKEQGLLRPPRALPRLRLRALEAIHPRSVGSCSRALRDVVTEAIRKELKKDAPLAVE